MSKLAIQRYYARLVHRGTYTMDKVPDEDKEKVEELVKEMGPYIPDPETETPAVDDKIPTTGDQSSSN